MKTKTIQLALTGLALSVLLAACEHDVAVRTEVYADGALDRSITLYEQYPTAAGENYFGINKDSGWTVVVEPRPSTETENEPRVNITFSKRFSSAQQANAETDAPGDTQFRIASTFQKENRWFYTYIVYTDTYRGLNNFNFVSMEDFITREDLAFIDRLPPEGRPISKADSIYLVRLDEKIFDIYGSRTIFEELYSHLLKSMQEQDVPRQWEDSVVRRKEVLFNHFTVDGEPDLLPGLNSLKIVLPESVRESIEQKKLDIEQRAQFVSDAYSGRYVHSVTMPWRVIESNADSVSGNQVFWKPPVIKFLLKDYTMTATARKMNIWAVIISALIVLGTVVLFLYRKVPARQP